jgi:hypothetical protein
MPRYTDYKCGFCGRDYNDDPDRKEKLFAKVVTFRELGANAKLVRSRTVGFIDVPCMELDEDYNRQAGKAPGQVSPARERVRAAQEAIGGQ